MASKYMKSAQHCISKLKQQSGATTHLIAWWKSKILTQNTGKDEKSNSHLLLLRMQNGNSHFRRQFYTFL